MKTPILKLTAVLFCFALMSCNDSSVKFTADNLTVVNRQIVDLNEEENSFSLNNQLGDGLAIINDLEFESGSLRLEIKGEDVQGKSFVGIAFNVQNDSTYEAVYFRPFNFRSQEQIRREHAMQYIYHPKNTWYYLRENFEGKYEAEFPRQPEPNDWFEVVINIDPDRVFVYDVNTQQELLRVDRLSEQVSNKVALWTGHDSKGWFRNLRVGE